jgi:CO dehydrogenase/acetyl-CoA synthase alpha subunit
VGYEVYVRVGETVAAVSLEGPQDMPLQQVTELAAAQAACLDASACPEALPVPEAILAGAAATPAAA